MKPHHPHWQPNKSRTSSLKALFKGLPALMASIVAATAGSAQANDPLHHVQDGGAPTYFEYVNVGKSQWSDYDLNTNHLELKNHASMSMNMMWFQNIGKLDVTDGAILRGSSIRPWAAEVLNVSRGGRISITQLDSDYASNFVINLTDGGVLKANYMRLISRHHGKFTSGYDSSATSTINIGVGGQAGHLRAKYIESIGNSILNFNHTDQDHGFDSILSGRFTLNFLNSGSTTLTADSSHYGYTKIFDQATLILGNSSGSATGTSKVEVIQGTLAGTGSAKGNVHVIGGTLAPGNPKNASSTGTLTLGNLKLYPSATVAYELTAPGAQAAGVNDFIVVEGDLELNGTLDILSLGDFGSYDLMEYGGTLTNSGIQVRTDLDGVDVDDLFVDESVAGKIRLNYATLAALQHWDGDSTSANGQTDGGSGVWNASLTQWTNTSGSIQSAWQERGAYFGTQAGTITLGGDIAFTKLRFGVSGYEITSTGDHQLQAAKDASIQVDTGHALISAPLAVGGTLHKLGSGDLLLRGTHQAQLLHVQNGALRLKGTLEGSVFNEATFAPGNSIGTATITGDYHQDAQGVLEIEIASATEFDKLIVQGTAYLDGTLKLELASSDISLGESLVFLEAQNVVGSFHSIEHNLGGEFRPVWIHGEVKLAPSSFTHVAKTDNEREVAKALNRFILSNEADHQEIVSAFDVLELDQFAQAFDAISPSFYGGVVSSGLELGHGMQQLLHQQLHARRLAGRIENVPQTPSADDAKAPTSTPEFAPRWSAWFQGSGMFGSGGVSLSPGEDFESGAFMVGADYLVNDVFALGFFTGYQEGWTHGQGHSDLDVEAVRFGLYATYDREGTYANWVLGAGQQQYEIDRPIQWAAMNRSARSNPEALEFFSSFSVGQDYKRGKWTFGPQATLQYQHLALEAFEEKGAGALDLWVDDQDFHSLRSFVGARLAYEHRVNDRLTILPEVRAFWQHEFLDGRHFTAKLDGENGPAFQHRTKNPDRDSLYLGAGVGFQMGERLYANLYYNVDLDRNGSENQTLSVSATFRF